MLGAVTLTKNNVVMFAKNSLDSGIRLNKFFTRKYRLRFHTSW